MDRVAPGIEVRVNGVAPGPIASSEQFSFRTLHRNAFVGQAAARMSLAIEASSVSSVLGRHSAAGAADAADAFAL